MPDSAVVMMVHGGADPLPREEMTPERERAYREALTQALRSGHAALRAPGGTALNAVEAAIRVLEDSPLFNAGRGAAFDRDGRNTLDASIIEGKTRTGGAVAGLTRVRNPIAAARAVMERSGHVLMQGPGADAFAEEAGLEIVDPSYFRTEERWEALQETLRSRPAPEPSGRHRIGTVGAVARDPSGSLAAGASTGGTTGKRPGRVGDTALIGSGTYAEDTACAVSCTGDGEYFIRLAVAHEIVALVKHAGCSVAEAARRVILGSLKDIGGEGGAIVLGADGDFAMPFHSRGMYRGAITADGTIRTAIYDDGPPP